jgi:hypothetical protein
LQAAGLAPAAECQMTSLRDASLLWRQWVRFSTRGRSMTFRPVTGGNALLMRGRGFSWLTIFDSG